jgi:uncharacterized protein YfiM (DUF2279 family)
MSEREAVETKIAEARRQRGAALLDGAKFDGKMIADLEAHLAALDDAAGVAVSREREAAEQARLAAAAAELKIALAAEKERLDGYAEIEAATRALREGLQKIFKANVTEADAICAMTGKKPGALYLNATLSEIAGRFCSIIATLPQCRAGLGPLKHVRERNGFPPGSDWRAAQAKKMKPTLDELEAEYGSNS